MVSIVVPIYNTAKYLNRCVDSLLNQSYSNLEVILVDDGSTDHSGAICDDYRIRDRRVKVIHQPNLGESNARNAGLEVATGAYIAFCDSDDEYKPDAFNLLRQAIESCDLALGAYLEVSAGKTRYASTGETPYCVSELALRTFDDNVPYRTKYILSCLQAKIFKNSIIREHHLRFDAHWVVGNDGLFVLDYLQHCEKIIDTFIPMYIYYKYDVNERVQGMAWSYPDIYRLHLEMYKKYFELLNEQYTKERMSSTFSDLFGLLIRAYKYKHLYTRGFDDEIYWFVNDPFVRQCAEHYVPIREYESKTISTHVLAKDYDAIKKEIAQKSMRLPDSAHQFVRRVYNEK